MCLFLCDVEVIFGRHGNCQRLAKQTTGHQKGRYLLAGLEIHRVAMIRIGWARLDGLVLVVCHFWRSGRATG
jgi:hypothetical protein